MSPGLIFALAEQAHHDLEPLMEPLGGRLVLTLKFEGQYPGVDAYIHDKNDPGAALLGWQTAIQTGAELAKFVAKVKSLASVTA